jgi:proteasome accessory factor A
MAKSHASDSTASALPKLCGADIELGNFLLGVEQVRGTGYRASRALLAQIGGLPLYPNGSYAYNYNGSGYYAASYGASGYSGASYRGSGYAGDSYHGYGSPWSSTSLADKETQRTGTAGALTLAAYNPQDVSRRFLLSNGGCAYIDLDHLEICLPEVLSAFDHVAAWHGMLKIVRTALQAANAALPSGQRIQVLVNTSDGQGNSYGSHLNFLIGRRTFDNLFHRKAHYLQYLASFQVSSILLTGQGKVGAENGRATTPYQLSQRADFCATLQGVQTTYDRPIVNSRDENLCGRGRRDDPAAPARLHAIFHDSALAHGSGLFRVGPMQLILTLIELGLVNSHLILDDPLDALLAFSHDPTLQARAALISGERLTALELQTGYLEEVKRYAARGVFEGIVPRAEEIVALWQDTLEKLAKGDWMAVAPRLDWVMKLMAVERALEQRPELDWDSPEIKVIDHLYSSLDSDGLYWAYEASGFAEKLVPPARIDYFTANPPADTRAWTRAMLLRRADPESVVSVDWDAITFKLRGRYNWPSYRTLDLANPLAGTEAETQAIFAQNEDFEDLIDALEAHLTRGAQPVKARLTN